MVRRSIKLKLSNTTKNNKRRGKQLRIVVRQPKKARVPRKRKSRPQSKRQMPLMLSPCAAQYAIALAEPFSKAALGVCVPRLSRPSRKASVITRTSGIIGTGGIGLILVTPSLASDMFSLVVSSTGFAGYETTNVLIGGVTPTTGMTAFFSPVPYVLSSLYDADIYENLVQGRMVCAGIRVEFDDVAINEGGHIHAYVHPDHQNLNAYPISSAMEVIDRPYRMDEPFELTLAAISDEEQGYANNQLYNVESGVTAKKRIAAYPFCNGQAFSVDDPDKGAAIAKICIYGKVGSGFKVTYIQHVEYVGKDVTGLTPVTQDIEGLNKVTEIHQKTVTSMKDPDSGSWTKTFKANIKEAVHLVSELVDLKQAITGLTI